MVVSIVLRIGRNSRRGKQSRVRLRVASHIESPFHNAIIRIQQANASLAYENVMMSCLKRRSSDYRASKVALPDHPALTSIEAVANPIARSGVHAAGIGDRLVQNRVG